MNRRNFIKMFAAIPFLPISIFSEDILAATTTEDIMGGTMAATIPPSTLSEGIWENILSVNSFLEDIPKFGISGNALCFSKPGRTTTSRLINIIGDAQGSGLIQPSDYSNFDMKAYYLVSKAKTIGRHTLNIITNGNEDKDSEFNGLFKSAGREIKGKNNLLYLDYDWVMLNAREFRVIKKRKKILKHLLDKKIYVNNFIDREAIIVGKFNNNDGRGISLIYANTDDKGIYKGIKVSELSDDTTRISFYPSLVVFDDKDITVINI